MVRAEDYFDPAALELSSAQQKTADLHYFATAGGQQPGTWPVTIWVNDQQVSEGNITFVEENGTLVPVLTAAQLAEYGVNVSAFSSFERLHDGETFTRIGQYIPDASSRFDFPTQRLNLSIPQAAMNVQREGYIDPARWDEGIPAAFVDYTLSGAQTGQSTHNGRSTFLNLRSGVNLEAVAAAQHLVHAVRLHPALAVAQYIPATGRRPAEKPAADWGYLHQRGGVRQRAVSRRPADVK